MHNYVDNSTFSRNRALYAKDLIFCSMRISNVNLTGRRGKNERFSKRSLFICGFAAVILFSIFRTALLGKDAVYNKYENDMEVFQLVRQPQSSYPPHLNPINPDVELKHAGFESIDTTHRNGLIHIGTWIHIVNSSLEAENPQILLIKRGMQLVTCPGTWSLIGEHAFRDETPLNTVRRGVNEEVGQRALDHIDRYGSIRNMTEYPVYYARDYGPNNGGRIDRQITYLWLVEMNLEKSDVSEKERDLDFLLDLDDEVADHKWISLSEFEEWVNADKTASNKDFCHMTIASLISLGIDRLKTMREKST